MTATDAQNFPYIPCPPDPWEAIAEHKARIEELELQNKNLASILNTVHWYLSDNKPIIDWIKQIKETKELNDQKEIQAFLGWLCLDL